MKNVCCFIFLLLFGVVQLYAQTTPVDPKSPKDLIDPVQPASFPGGEQALLNFVIDNIRYPAEARKNSIEGNVVVGFTIGKDGKISDITIMRPLGGGCSEEVLRIIDLMPLWIPAKNNGDLIAMKYMLPVRFRL